MKKRIDLVYFEGCPNAGQARENIGAAILRAHGEPGEWAEWDLTADSTPDEFRRYASPTVLVDGVDVTRDAADVRAIACRSDGVPSVELIAARLV